MTCNARIRPFRMINDVEVRCEKDVNHGGTTHSGVLRDYAHSGSETQVTWYETDRRLFYSDWPGACNAGILEGCVLPRRHQGRCAN